MALDFTTLIKPVSKQVIDPDTGEVRSDWNLFFQGLTERLNGAVSSLATDPPPSDAEYLVGAANGSLTAERVATNSTSNTWNLSTPGQASVERQALTGDVTAPANSNTTTIQAGAVSFSKMQDIATDRLIGRDTASSGDPEEISVGGGLEFTGSQSIQRAALTGDVIATAGSNSTTIADDAVTYAKMQNVSATSRLLGRKTSGSGDPEELTLSEALDLIGSAVQGDLLYRGSSDWARLGAGTNGHFLKTQGAGADPQWAAAASWALVVKTTDENTASDTTLSDDAALVIPMLADTDYIIRGEVYYDTPAAADFKFSFNGPSGANLIRIAHYNLAPDATAFGAEDTHTAYGVSTSATASSGTFGWVALKALIRNGANAGNFSFQWAQNTSTASNTTVRAGSYLEYRIVS